MYIKLYRLVDGAHVIGKQEKHSIKDALQVTMTPEVDQAGNRTGQTVIGVVPMLYPFIGKPTGSEISLDHVVCFDDCPSQLLNVYMQAISTPQSFQVPTLETIDGVEKVQQGPL